MATDKMGDLQLFIEAAALGNLSAAGRKLGISPAAASVRLAKLEASLRTRLFDRTTRSLRLTHEGRTYAQQCRAALEGLAEAEATLLAGHAQVIGKIRISASSDFGRHLFNEWLQTFSRQHPQLQLALTLTDSLSKLMQDDMDIAIRFGKPDDGDVVARRLAPNWRVLCASPSYLKEYGTPQTPDDLTRHRFIVLVNNSGPLNDYHFALDGRHWTQRIPMDQAWETNDSALATTWAVAGFGIARKTIWDAAADLRAGRLQVVLPQYAVKEPGIYAILHRNRYQVPRVQMLMDFLKDQFEKASRKLIMGLPGEPVDGPPL